MTALTLPRVDLRAKLSALWIFLLINMIYADILSFSLADTVRDILAGNAGGITITPEFMLLAAVMTEIPMVMVIASRLLNYRLNRLANIVSGIFTIVYVIGLGSLTPHYIFIASIEVLCAAWIVWLAWQWRD
ncbi:MAG TPA: DUF6326 family protein [Anaerolineales bacterium]|nr:DUF6326 family protein [Anaerolineales bacterium]HRF49085.1 DUF6326 family protein [Anaerolineales bacterium]